MNLKTVLEAMRQRGVLVASKNELPRPKKNNLT